MWCRAVGVNLPGSIWSLYPEVPTTSDVDVDLLAASLDEILSYVNTLLLLSVVDSVPGLIAGYFEYGLTSQLGFKEPLKGIFYTR